MKTKISFITNSSSSHYIMKTNKKLKDDIQSTYYGWDYFTIASRDEKLKYMAVTLFVNLIQLKSEQSIDDIVNIVEDATGIELKDNEFGIDHQSLIVLPKSYESNKINIKFFKDLLDYILQDNIVILGGNDNDSTPHNYITYCKHIPFRLMYDEKNNLFCTKENEYWILSDKINKYKQRIKFPKT